MTGLGSNLRSVSAGSPKHSENSLFHKHIFKGLEMHFDY